jgi:hypothetical protein
MINRFFRAVLFCALALPLGAITTYSVDNRGGACVASRVIRAGDSGMTNGHYAVVVYDSTPALVPRSHYSASIDSSSYDLTLTFGSTYWPSGHCGVIHLRGVYGSGDTSSTSDFLVSVSGGQINITHAGAYSQRTVNGLTYASDVNATAGVTFSDYCIGEDYVYFAAGTGRLTVASDVDALCLSADAHTTVVYGTGWPAGSVHLARVANNGTSLVVDGDFRPW